MNTKHQVLLAEEQYATELAFLAAYDQGPKPPGWLLTPRAVVTFVCGETGLRLDKDAKTEHPELPARMDITAKFIGDRSLVERCVVTLAGSRALMLVGEPGTAKSMLSELLAAAICGSSELTVQGSAGTTEDQLRYGWNYARLLAEGPSEAALVPSPIMTAMERGTIARVEELTRMPSDVQDGMITTLSEKTLPVPELGMEVQARAGFNLIATANDRDRGVNDLSSALRRRFNTVVLPLPSSAEEELRIVTKRVAELGRSLELPEATDAIAEIRRVVTVFRELRQGHTEDNKTSLKTPSATLSAAEAISVVTNGLALAAHFGDGVLRADDVAAGIVGAVVKDPVADQVIWQEYLQTVVRERTGWKDFYRACRQVAR